MSVLRAFRVAAFLGALLSAFAQDDRQQCYNTLQIPQRCLPPFGNVAFGREVDATNSCGVRERQQFCIQNPRNVSDIGCNNHCDISYPPEAHPPNYITDFHSQETWWQSETLAENVMNSPVNLTIDFQRPYIVYHIIISFHASSPDSFVIYKRRDPTAEWEPFKYYSAYCETDFGLEDISLVERSNSQENVATCSSEGLEDALQDGTVAFRPLEEYGDERQVTDDTVVLSRESWLTVSQIRISLRSLSTFGDDILKNERSLDSYFYAISDVNIGARCQCHGHAKECKMDPRQPGYRRCLCEHNTEGEQCERCRPLFNNRKWAPATAQNANECRQCNCNGRASSCVFDKQLYEETNGLVGARCVNCSHNRDGVHCEKCKENFFENAEGVCAPCGCNVRGSANLQCVAEGQCVCKPGVGGRYCDECLPNHYDFTDEGCKSCECSTAGSKHDPPECDVVTGKCNCKDNVEGQRCEMCRPGFFDLDAGNDRGCVACFCHSHTPYCTSDTAHFKETILSEFKRGPEKWTAENDHGESVQVRYEQSERVISVDARDSMVYFVAPEAFLGDRRFSYNRYLNFTLRIDTEYGAHSMRDIVLEGPNNMVATTRITVNGQPAPNALGTQYSVRLHELSGWQPSMAAFEFIKLLKELRKLKIRGTYQKRGLGFLERVSLESATTSVSDDADPEPAPWVERCMCGEAYHGQFCEQCETGYRRDPRKAHLGPYATCVPCKCHNHSDSCDSETGRCICTHNTTGMFCELCEDGFFGNSLIGNEDDCSPCPCPNQGKCTLLPDNSVMCLDCPTGYKGKKCEACDEGYYGDPQALRGEPTECTPCECNGNVDRDSINYCDNSNGKCLKCIFNTAGDFCEVCKPGFFGNALAEKKNDCKRCNCHVNGTSTSSDLSSRDLVLECDMESGQCPCKNNVVGLRCDQCREGYWNLASRKGCEDCACNMVGSKNDGQCDVLTGVCTCQPGVMEPKCDACQMYFYDFSAEGCKACDCDPTGSSEMQCDVETGQCKCRPNFVGRTCNQCKRNTYYDEPTCKPCDYCYSLVLDNVELHEQMLQNVSQLLVDVQRSPLIEEESSDFDEKFGKILQEAETLSKEAQSLARPDNDVAKKFQAKTDAMKELEAELNDAEPLIDSIVKKTDSLKEKSKDLSAINQHNRHLISQVTNYVESDAAEALTEATAKSQQATRQSSVLKNISSEIRAQVEKIEDDVAATEENVRAGRGQAEASYAYAQKLSQDATKATETLATLKKQQTDLRSTMARVLSSARSIQLEASEIFQRALGELTEINSTRLAQQESIEGLTDRARGLNKEAIQLAKSEHEAREVNDPFLKDARDVEAEARPIVDEAQQTQGVIDQLVLRVNDAYKQSKSAVDKGNEIMEQAKLTLDTLMNFDKTVETHRTEAQSQLTKIPEILESISAAVTENLKADRRMDEIHDGAKLVKTIAAEAKTTSLLANKSMEENKKLAAEQNLRVASLQQENDQFEKDIAQTNSQLESFHAIVDNQQQSLDRSSIDISDAKASAFETYQTASTALNEVISILNQLKSADSYDANHLTGLGKKMTKLEEQYNNTKAMKQTKELEQTMRKKAQLINNYQEELDKLKADVQNIADIRATLPNACFGNLDLEPIG